MHRAIGEWLPFNMIAKMHAIVADFLWSCMRNNEGDPNFDHLCLNTLKWFAFDGRSVEILKAAMLHEQWMLILEGKETYVQLNFR